MSLADALQAQKARRAGPPCGIATLLDDLEPADAETLREALNGPYQHTEISRALKSQGHEVSTSKVSWHRNGNCKCEAAA